MKRSKAASEAGERLKVLRLRLGMSTRQVERLSHQIAETKNNHEFHISHAWLTNIETGEFTPSIFKLYSLSAIYRHKLSDLLGVFGLNLGELGKDLLSIRLPATHLIGKALEVEGEGLRVPTSFGEEFRLEKTGLISRMIENWGKIPLPMVSHLNFGSAMYGYIGLEDFTLYPLLRPGSFVEIDSRQKKIKPIQWRSEFERPIYFVELHGAYVCSWCELDGDELIVVPHPESHMDVRRYRYRAEAEIVGRVTAVAMRLLDLPPATA